MNNREFYPSLEILRGLCAAEVFVWHIFAHADADLLSSIGLGPLSFMLWRLSEPAVLTFMSISGFVVANSFFHYRTTIAGEVKAAWVFLAARAIRIWSLSVPVALVSLVLTFIYRGWAQDARPWKRFTDYDQIWLSMFGLHKEWLGPGWTLLYEIFGYCLLPLGLLMLLSRSWSIRAGSLLATVLVLFIFIEVLEMDVETAYPMMGCFLIGVVSFFVRSTLLRMKPRTGWLVAMIGFAGLLVLARITTDNFDNIAYKVVACGVLFVGFLAIVPGSGFLSRKLQLLGACSYSLYLWHWPVIYFGNFYAGQLLYGGLGTASAWTWPLIFILIFVWVPLTFVVTALSYTYVERRVRMSAILPGLRRWRSALATS